MHIFKAWPIKQMFEDWLASLLSKIFKRNNNADGIHYSREKAGVNILMRVWDIKRGTKPEEGKNTLM